MSQRNVNEFCTCQQAAKNIKSFNHIELKKLSDDDDEKNKKQQI